MSDGTKIEWAEASWNPIRARNRETGAVGWFCTHASPGCIECYAEAMNARLGTGIAFQAQNAGQVEIFIDEKTLLQPLKWRKPRRIFVCSMTDLFGEFVFDDMIDRVFAIMALCPQHEFLVLTKRPARMRDFIVNEPRARIYDLTEQIGGRGSYGTGRWPLDNVWLGTSIEDRRRAIERLAALMETPAAVRFVSAEPLLESIITPLKPYLDTVETENNGPIHHALDWIIVGGESGRRARPFDLDWAAEIVAECQRAGVPVFVKQVGAKPIRFNAEFWCDDPKGGDPAEWPEAIRVRQFPEPRR